MSCGLNTCGGCKYPWAEWLPPALDGPDAFFQWKPTVFRVLTLRSLRGRTQDELEGDVHGDILHSSSQFSSSDLGLGAGAHGVCAPGSSLREETHTNLLVGNKTSWENAEHGNALLWIFRTLLVLEPSLFFSLSTLWIWFGFCDLGVNYNGICGDSRT